MTLGHQEARACRRHFMQALLCLVWAMYLSAPAEAFSATCIEQVETAVKDDRRWTTICKEESGAWEIRYLARLGRIGPLTAGSALRLFYLPEGSGDQPGEVRQPITLTMVSERVWAVGFLDGKGPKASTSNESYFVWVPGIRRPYGVPIVDWVEDDVRVFRCLNYEGFSCVSYYAVPACDPDMPSERRDQFAISVFKRTDSAEQSMFDDFEATDRLVRRLIRVAAKKKCGG